MNKMDGCDCDDRDDIALTPDERAAGFSVQTLQYPERYELPRLAGDKGRRLERTVALVIDDVNRITRRRIGSGYLHETLTDSGWTVSAELDSLDALRESDVYRRRPVEPVEPVGWITGTVNSLQVAQPVKSV